MLVLFSAAEKVPIMPKHFGIFRKSTWKCENFVFEIIIYLRMHLKNEQNFNFDENFEIYSTESRI